MEKAVAETPLDSRAADKMFWVLLTAGLLLFAIVTIPPGAREAGHLKANLLRAREASRQLTITDNILRDREKALQNDPFYAEAALRANMKYTKPGEKEISVPQTQDRSLLVGIPKPEEYVPDRMRATGVVSRMTSWSLLAASALLVATAFIFFDRPASR
jgi:hypothetical protein